jgi:hypothetical protein
MTLPNEFMVVGSEELLKPLILQLMALHYGGGSGSGGSGGIKEVGWFPGVKEKIKVTLRFIGRTNTGKYLEVEKSIRLMAIDPATVTLEQLQNLARKIHSKFDNWSHQTGKISCNYVRKDQGYQLQQIHVPTLAEGKRVIEQILDIQSHSPDWEFLTYNQSDEPQEAYPETPHKHILAGYSIRKPQRRPLGSVSFTEATISFPATNFRETLCTRGGQIIKNLDSLKSLADND